MTDIINEILEAPVEILARICCTYPGVYDRSFFEKEVVDRVDNLSEMYNISYQEAFSALKESY